MIVKLIKHGNSFQILCGIKVFIFSSLIEIDHYYSKIHYGDGYANTVTIIKNYCTF